MHALRNLIDLLSVYCTKKLNPYLKDVDILCLDIINKGEFLGYNEDVDVLNIKYKNKNIMFYYNGYSSSDYSLCFCDSKIVYRNYRPSRRVEHKMNMWLYNKALKDSDYKENIKSILSE